jgi:hypothetical protein
VPIPFRDAADLDDLGVASFLRIERSERGSTYLGALFSVNARGEPIELVYNALETPHPFLWRPSDLRRHAERRLTASLLAAAESVPRLLFCLADEVGAELFTQDLTIDVPVGRVERPIAAPPTSNEDDAPGAAPPMPAQVFWHPAPPAEESTERALFEQLASRGLLLEPFDRATDGLREVYGARPSDADA